MLVPRRQGPSGGRRTAENVEEISPPDPRPMPPDRFPERTQLAMQYAEALAAHVKEIG